MIFDIEFDIKAEIEYIEAIVWYEKKSEGLGGRFENSVLQLVKSIAENPLIYPNKKLATRECKVHDFPYLVVYKIYPAKNLIYVISIFHTSRNPKKKYRK